MCEYSFSRGFSPWDWRGGIILPQEGITYSFLWLGQWSNDGKKIFKCLWSELTWITCPAENVYFGIALKLRWLFGKLIVVLYPCWTNNKRFYLTKILLECNVYFMDLKLWKYIIPFFGIGMWYTNDFHRSSIFFFHYICVV